MPSTSGNNGSADAMRAGRRYHSQPAPLPAIIIAANPTTSATARHRRRTRAGTNLSSGTGALAPDATVGLTFFGTTSSYFAVDRGFTIHFGLSISITAIAYGGSSNARSRAYDIVV
jgi:hypothetical protein